MRQRVVVIMTDDRTPWDPAGFGTRQPGSKARMHFELNYGDIGILFFLTLGPLKAILPFARVTRGTDPGFRRSVAWQGTAIATAIVVVVALLAPFVLTNWHVSPPAIIITGGIILF